MRGVHFTILPASPCATKFYEIWHTRSTDRRNHMCQIFSRSVQGLWSSDIPKIAISQNLLHRPYNSVALPCDTVINSTDERTDDSDWFIQCSQAAGRVVLCGKCHQQPALIHQENTGHLSLHRCAPDTSSRAACCQLMNIHESSAPTNTHTHTPSHAACCQLMNIHEPSAPTNTHTHVFSCSMLPANEYT